MIQRSIGGQPGPWGVAGTFWAIGCVLGVWLLTSPRTLQGDFETHSALRNATRWTATLSVGAIAGYLLSSADLYIPPHGGVSLNLYVVAVAICELPANTLLYLWLARLSSISGDRRTSSFLGAYCAAVPAILAAAVLLLALGSAASEHLKQIWRLAGAIYGAVAVTTGIVATAAVGRLAVVYTIAAMNGLSIRSFFGTAQRLQSALATVDAHRWRICAIIGMPLLIWSAAENTRNVVGFASRKGLAGDVPMLNFPGPKLIIAHAAVAIPAPEFEVRYLRYRLIQPEFNISGIPVLVNLVAICLLTCKRESPAAFTAKRWKWRGLTRWLAVVGVAVPLGMILGRWWDNGISPSRVTAKLSLLCEAPLTVLLYLRLAELADGHLARKLKLFAFIIPLLIAAPMGAFVLSASMRPWHGSIAVGAICGAWVAIETGTALMASFTIGRLAWELAIPMFTPSAPLTST